METDGIKKVSDWRTVMYAIDEYSKYLIEQIEMLPDCNYKDSAIEKVKSSLELCKTISEHNDLPY